MKCEKIKCPMVTKCCYCVPLRKGIMIFGYVNLIFSLLCLPILIFMLLEEVTAEKIYAERADLDPMVHLPVTITFVVVDVIVTIVMLVGAHKRNKKLLKVYFYIDAVFQIIPFFIDITFFPYNSDLENAAYFLFFGLNIYLLFLVYNAIYVIEENIPVQYYTHQNQRVGYV